MSDTAFSTDTYISFVNDQLSKLSDEGAMRTYMHVGGRLIGDKHAARVLPGYDPDIKLLVVQSFAKKAAFVYCVSAADLERGRVRGDNGLSYAEEVCRSLDELAQHDITVDTIVIVGNTVASHYEKITDYALRNGKRIVPWKSDVSVLTDGFSIDSFEDNERILFDDKIIVVLSPGSNSGKFDFCLQQLQLESDAGEAVAYVRLQVFPVPTLHPWHPINLAYFAATADVYENKGLFGATDNSVEAAWGFYQKDANIAALLGEINKRGGDHHLKVTTLSIEQGIVSETVAEREGAAELLRRYMRYWHEVKLGQERPETLVFTKRLVALLFDRYQMK